MPRKYAYDYYDVYIPRDVFLEEQKNNNELFRLAFAGARERAIIWSRPCIWTARLLDDPDSADYHVRVCRKRRNVPTIRPHYHVLTGIPGYMPDDNFICKTKADAEWDASQQAEDFRSLWNCVDDCPMYKVLGSKHDGYEVYRLDAIHPAEVYMTISITQCYEEDCLKEMAEQNV